MGSSDEDRPGPHGAPPGCRPATGSPPPGVEAWTPRCRLGSRSTAIGLCASAHLDDDMPRKRLSSQSTTIGHAASACLDGDIEDSDSDVLAATTSTTCSVDSADPADVFLTPCALAAVKVAALERSDSKRCSSKRQSPPGAVAPCHAPVVKSDSARRGSSAEGHDRGSAGDELQKRRFGFLTLALLCIAFGCSCQGPYEVMNAADKGCAHLVSLAEHLFGLAASAGAIRRRRRLPLALHLCMALGSVGYTQLQNAALGTSLPTMVLVTLKNGNLVANMFLGRVVMGRSYSARQKAAVLLVTFGLVCTTLPGGDAGADAAGAEWGCVLGVVLLSGALICRAAGGILQEAVCHDYCAPVDELLLYRNVMGLPCVLLHWRSIWHHAERWSAGSEALGVAWPGLWAFLIANVLFDHVTRVAVTHLIEETSALTANLVLTIQRFVAFIISATILSSKPVQLNVWLGAVAVLGGSTLYSLACLARERAEPARRADEAKRD